MGWRDRDYNRSVNYGGNPFSNPIASIFFGSVYIGTLFRVRIRVHASFIWILVARLIFAAGDWRDMLVSNAFLFGIVFLHEFGHIFACRYVGGDADEILMWPLGGLAFAAAPKRPWPQFVTVAGGPLVNVIIGAILTVVIFFLWHVIPPLNPLFPFLDSAQISYYLRSNPGRLMALFGSPAGHWLFWLFTTNWMILFFNLIPMFPLDGGQMVQAILWKPLGYVRSMKIACYLGLGFSVLVGLFGLRFGDFFLIAIAVFSFMGCFQQLRAVRMAGPEIEEPYDLSAAWESTDSPAFKRKRHSKRWLRAARRKANRDQAEQAKIDAILAKVKDKGLHSLSWFEKRALRRATERQRQRDLANRL